MVVMVEVVEMVEVLVVVVEVLVVVVEVVVVEQKCFAAWCRLTWS